MIVGGLRTLAIRAAAVRRRCRRRRDAFETRDRAQALLQPFLVAAGRDVHDAACPLARAAKRLGGTLADELAAVDDQHATAARLDLRKDVRREQHGLLAGEALDQRAHLADLVRVET